MPLLVLLAAGCGTTTAVVSRAPEIRFTSPLAGPGQPDVSPAEHKRIDRGWSKLISGQVAAALVAARRSEGVPQGHLLAVQGRLVGGSRVAVDELEELLSDHPDYASAWLTLSVAAEDLGNELTALAAARRVADLWPTAAWAGRADELATRWIENRVETAVAALQADDPDAALTGIERTLVLAPTHRAALLVKARALTALERYDAAEVILAGLTDNVEALVLAGSLAERRRDWRTAMEIYEVLPEDHQQRAEALLNAQVQWRLSNMPPYVQNALASTEITRAEMAIIVLTLRPQLEAVDGGQVPVLSDIVDLAYQREILAAVRLGIVAVDPLEPRFHPDDLVTQEEARGALEAMCHLLGYPTPVWCVEDSVVSSCTEIPDSVGGAAFADLTMRLAQRKADD